MLHLVFLEAIEPSDNFGRISEVEKRISKVNDDLIDAAMKGDLERLTEALTNEADPNASRDMYGLSALHYVVTYLSGLMVSLIRFPGR